MDVILYEGIIIGSREEGTIMKYGESSFDLLYLLFAVISGCIILKNAENRKEKLMGTALCSWSSCALF